MKIIDRWNECYEGIHQQTPPEQFKQLFCSQCMNTSCTNSKGAGMAWVQRMSTQADRLLNNPNFANIEDPEFQAIRSLDFKNLLREQITIHLSEEKGDWSVPSEREISREAAKINSAFTGQPMPQGFLIEPKEEKQPEIEEISEDEITEVSEEDTEEPIGVWKLKGSKDVLQVSEYKDGTWTCTCGFFVHRKQECKHIMRIKGSKPLEKEETLPEKEEQVIPRRPPPTPSNPALNTQQNQGGYVIGGGDIPPEEPEQDPWAAPKGKPPTKTIPVGGKFTFGSNKKK